LHALVGTNTSEKVPSFAEKIFWRDEFFREIKIKHDMPLIDNTMQGKYKFDDCSYKYAISK